MAWIAPAAPFLTTLKEAEQRFVRVEETLARVTDRLAAEGIDYAVIGGMALVAHRYVRFTNDVDILTTPEGLEVIHKRLVGRGYVAAFPGARKKIRDAQTGIDVEFITTGEFPGDGKPKPVVFPIPAEASIDVEGRRVIALPKLIELKLASGLSARHRLRDLADVQDLITALALPRDLGEMLDPSVRDEYHRMWDESRSAQ